MRYFALLVITAASCWAQFVPKYEQGYVSTLQGTHVQALAHNALPTAETTEALALKFSAKIAVRGLDGGAFKYWVPLEPLPQGWQWQFEFHWPFGKTKPAIQRSLVLEKGSQLPNGYALSKEVVIAAGFFANAFERKEAALAEADCWAMIQAHDEQTK